MEMNEFVDDAILMKVETTLNPNNRFAEYNQHFNDLMNTILRDEETFYQYLDLIRNIEATYFIDLSAYADKAQTYLKAIDEMRIAINKLNEGGWFNSELYKSISLAIEKRR